jgi:hypothetical protein
MGIQPSDTGSQSCHLEVDKGRGFEDCGPGRRGRAHES